jgi:hypothetical protein
MKQGQCPPSPALGERIDHAPDVAGRGQRGSAVAGSDLPMVGEEGRYRVG